MLKYWISKLCCLIFLIAGCTEVIKFDPQPERINNGVLIINEGNFLQGNGSLTYYNDSTQEIIPDIFEAYNGRKLGDVVQSVQPIGDEIFIVVNNSGKIEVVDRKNFKSTGVIQGLRSPRYILPISSQKAYVSDLYENAVTIIDPKAKTILGKIPLRGWSEQMVKWNNQVWVASVYSEYVYILDAQTDKLLDSLPVGKGIAKLKIVDNTIWALAAVNQDSSILASILPGEKKVGARIKLAPMANAKFFDFINQNDLIYLLSAKGVAIYKISTQTQTLWFQKNDRNFYSFGYNPRTAKFYLADAKDYVQNGAIYIYDLNSVEPLKSFDAGIIPGDFHFL
jgi:DNA-binding beta-propeller fold protein YncE